MTDWKGRGLQTNVRARRDQILHILEQSDVPITTDEIAKKMKEPYSRVYQDLRALAGGGYVAKPDYPVIWHSWDTNVPNRTVWSLSLKYRDEASGSIAELQTAWEL